MRDFWYIRTINDHTLRTSGPCRAPIEVDGWLRFMDGDVLLLAVRAETVLSYGLIERPVTLHARPGDRW